MEQDLATPPDLGLVQDLCARLCHDLGGPLGSVTGALELLDQEPDAAAVARESVDAMGQRLRFWRAMMGGAGSMAREELAQLLQGALPAGRTRVDTSGLPPDDLSAGMAQVVLAAGLLAGEALPRGGVVHLAGDAGGIAVWPEGRSAGWPPSLGTVLAGDPVSGPREVLAALLLRLAAQAEVQVTLLLGTAPGAAPLTLRPA